MTEGPAVCIFSLSRKEFPKGIESAIPWLKNKRTSKGMYLFREKSPKRLPQGSVVVFSIENEIFGDGRVKTAPSMTSLKERRRLEKSQGHAYKAKMTIEPGSIRIFDQFPSRRKLMESFGAKFSRLFTYIDWQLYPQILELAGARLRKASAEEGFKQYLRSISHRELIQLIQARNVENAKIAVRWRQKLGKIPKRDLKLSLYLKEFYKDKCQVMNCSNDIEVPRPYFTDTHHIVPLSKGGRDESSNILVLCPNHHRLLHKSKIRRVRKNRFKVTLEIDNGELEVAKDLR